MKETTFERVCRLLAEDPITIDQATDLMESIGAGANETWSDDVLGTLVNWLDDEDMLGDVIQRAEERALDTHAEDYLSLYRWDRPQFPELDDFGVRVLAAAFEERETGNPADYGTVWIKVYQSDVERLRERVA